MAYLPCVLAGALLGATYIFPAAAAQAARDGLSLWARSLLPSLGPAMALCLFLCSRFPGKRMPVLFSAFLCGSPGGARLLRDLPHSPGTALHDAALTGVLSPLFFLSTLSQWLQSQNAALLIYICHLAGAKMAALFFRKEKSSPAAPSPLSLPKCAEQAIFALLQVGYYVMLGSVAARMAACALPHLPGKAAALLQCLMEITGGIPSLLPYGPSLPFLCALLSFGGFSVLMQNLAFWKEKGVTALQLTGIRLLHGLLSFLLCYFLQFLPFFG